MVIDGRIADFLLKREDGYAEFIFISDYTEDSPRFTAVCCGNVPDVVPGVPVRAEFQSEDIIKTDFRRNPPERLSVRYRQSVMNRLLYVSINYNDEMYALKLLTRVKGISSRTAQKILDAVDGDINKLAEHWDDAEFWKGFRGSRKYLEELKNSIGSLLEQNTLVKKYSRYGIGYPQAGSLLTVYGADAEDSILKNPYRALQTVDISFQAADHLAKDLGFFYLCQERLRAIVSNVLKENESQGNTAMPEYDFYMKCADMHRYSAWKDRAVPPYFLLATVSQMNSVYYDHGLIGFTSTMDMEDDIAYQLHRLAKTDTAMGVRDFDRTKYNSGQIEFLRAFSENSVVVLLGRGGTGKTYSICGAIDLFRAKYPKEEIRLCAPTARAAGVLKEHSGHPSSTIHVMLELAPYSSDREAGKNEDTPLDEKLIVVDEMSMVDTELMYYLLRAVKTGAKLILSGDPDQLESVGCGAVLRDIVNSGTVPVVKLTQIMRQNEGSAIIENCGRILAGKHLFMQNDSFRIRRCLTDEEACGYLKSCYDNDSKHSQIISTTRKGMIGTVSVNRIFENREGVYLHGNFYSEGDKVIFTRNNYSSGYCNGDVGYVSSQSPLTVQMEDGSELVIDEDTAVDMEHADAITIHKSQGSEYDSVYILLPEKPVSLLTRNMVNTAISRARKKVTLITVGDALNIAAGDRYKRNRVTRLEEKLRNITEERKEKDGEKDGEKDHQKTRTAARG